MISHKRKRKYIQDDRHDNSNDSESSVKLENEKGYDKDIIYDQIYSTPKKNKPRCLVLSNSKDNLLTNFTNLLKIENYGVEYKIKWYVHLFRICLFNERLYGSTQKTGSGKNKKEKGTEENINKLILEYNVDELLKNVQKLILRKLDCENLYYQKILVIVCLLFDYFQNRKHHNIKTIKHLEGEEEDTKNSIDDPETQNNGSDSQINGNLSNKRNDKSKRKKESKKRSRNASKKQLYDDSGDEDISKDRLSDYSENNHSSDSELLKNNEKKKFKPIDIINNQKNYYIIEFKNVLFNEKKKFNNLEIFYHITNFIIHKYWYSQEYAHYNIFIWFLNYINSKLEIKKSINSINSKLEMFINLHPKIFNISHAKKKRKKNNYQYNSSIHSGISQIHPNNSHYFESGIVDYPYVKNRSKQVGGGFTSFTNPTNSANTTNTSTTPNLNNNNFFSVNNNSTNNAFSGFKNTNTDSSAIGNTFGSAFKGFGQNNNVSIFGNNNAISNTAPKPIETGNTLFSTPNNTSSSLFGNSINNTTNAPATNNANNSMSKFPSLFSSNTSGSTNNNMTNMNNGMSSINNNSFNSQLNKPLFGNTTPIGNNLMPNLQNKSVNLFGSVNNNAPGQNNSNMNTTLDNNNNNAAIFGFDKNNQTNTSIFGNSSINGTGNNTNFVTTPNNNTTNNLFSFNGDAQKKLFQTPQINNLEKNNNNSTNLLNTSTNNDNNTNLFGQKNNGTGFFNSTINGNINKDLSLNNKTGFENDMLLQKTNMFSNTKPADSINFMNNNISNLNNNAAPSFSFGNNNSNDMLGGMSSNLNGQQNGNNFDNLFNGDNGSKELFKDLKISNEPTSKFTVNKKPLFSRRSVKNNLLAPNSMTTENNIFSSAYSNKDNLLNNQAKPAKVIFGQNANASTTAENTSTGLFGNTSNTTTNNTTAPILTEENKSINSTMDKPNLFSNTNKPLFNPPTNNTTMFGSTNTNIFGKPEVSNIFSPPANNNTLSSTDTKPNTDPNANTNNLISTDTSSSAFGNTSMFGGSEANNSDRNNSQGLNFPVKKLTLEERKRKTSKSNIMSLFSANTSGPNMQAANTSNSNMQTTSSIPLSGTPSLTSNNNNDAPKTNIFQFNATQTDTTTKTDTPMFGGLAKSNVFGIGKPQESFGEKKFQFGTSDKPAENTSNITASTSSNNLFGSKTEDKEKPSTEAPKTTSLFTFGNFTNKDKDETKDAPQTENKIEKDENKNETPKETPLFKGFGSITQNKTEDTNKSPNKSFIFGLGIKQEDKEEKKTSPLITDKNKDDNAIATPKFGFTNTIASSSNNQTNIFNIGNDNKNSAKSSIFVERNEKEEGSGTGVFSLNTNNKSKENTSPFSFKTDKEPSNISGINTFSSTSFAGNENKNKEADSNVNYDNIISRKRRKDVDLDYKDELKNMNFSNSNEDNNSLRNNETDYNNLNNNILNDGHKNNEGLFLKKSRIGNSLNDTKNILNTIKFDNIPSKDKLSTSFSEDKNNTNNADPTDRNIFNINMLLPDQPTKEITSTTPAPTNNESNLTKPQFNFLNKGNEQNNVEKVVNRNLAETGTNKQYEMDDKKTSENQQNFQQTSQPNESNFYISDAYRKNKMEEEKQNDFYERMRINEYLMNNNYNSDIDIMNNNVEKRNPLVIDKKSMNRIKSYNKHISFDSIDVDLDRDVVDINELRQDLFLCALNFHLHYWAEKVILFYPHNEKINKYCTSIIKIKNKFDETYNFNLFDDIHSLSRKLLKRLDKNCCIYESVLFLSGDNIQILKNAKLSLFDVFNIYHFWFKKNSSDIKKNLQDFLYTNKIYPSYLNYYMGLYKNSKSSNNKSTDLKENRTKIVKDVTSQNKLSDNEQDRKQSKSAFSFYEKFSQFAYPKQDSKSDLNNLNDSEVDKNLGSENELTNSTVDDEKSDADSSNDEHSDSSDKSANSGSQENSQNDRNSENSDLSEENLAKKTKSESEKKKKKKKVTENNLAEIFNSDSSDASNVLENNYDDEPFSMNINEKYLYLSKGKKRKKKLFLPSHIKIKKLSACECILLELILKDNVLNVLKKYKLFKREKYEYLYVNLIAMLKHYNYFSTDKSEDINAENGNNSPTNNIPSNSLKDKKYRQNINNMDKGSNLKRIANCLETNCANVKNDKINILKKICDKNLLYYINLQLKNIAHLLNYKEIEIACTYLNHIKNNLFVIFQIPILLFNVLYDKLIKSYNDFSIMDNYFNNSLLYKDFRYEYILKTKIAYMLLKKFNDQDDIENCIKFAIYFDNNRVKAHKNNIYNDYIFHKNLISSYIKVHENIVPSEWIEAKYAKDGELSDMNDSEYLDYYSFFFKDISKYIKMSIIDKIITSNIFSLHKENYTICQSAEDQDTNKKYKSNGGTNVGNNSKSANNTSENNETSQDDTEKKKNKFACYFMYMVRRSIMDDVVNIYSSKGEYFYKKLLTTLVNNNFAKDYEKSHNKHFHMFIQVANINVFMKNVFFEYINFFKKKELYNIEKIKNEDEIMDNLVNVVKVNGRNFFVVINTLTEIVTKIEKNVVKDVNINILINLRNIIIDTFYLFKYVFNNREFSLNLIENLYRNVINFNDTINSFFSDDVNFYPKEQIKDLYTHIRHKFTSQNAIN
ncbi:nucleoporin NUP313, putative [Plasmodium chabaudi chabaudi]|uniref:Nucleoporin NUP313, putative n=1 Tax=Plasmodium chabaudi chabaudi TaxID=31271 RepID=A0A4V0KCK8_PLACU|nr:nucleoporin NUP313, putative [Plasmodium chabaudi chabaudi]VTZ70086.1 nucleoporin NUP313, putative [Plasmodium chabaudi chabaudi]|eukprot:XP_016654473.1 conserved Plasmodium protein, unknown function [Plasmodium chabaudi chabaudi]